MYGLRFDGTRYDIGNKLDFLKDECGVSGSGGKISARIFAQFIIRYRCQEVGERVVGAFGGS